MKTNLKTTVMRNHKIIKLIAKYTPGMLIAGSLALSGQANSSVESAAAAVSGTEARLTVTATNAPANDKPLLLVEGNHQKTKAGVWNAEPLRVTVRDERQNLPLAAQAVAFSVLSGGGSLSTGQGGVEATYVTVYSDDNGLAQVWYKQPDSGDVASVIGATTMDQQAVFTTKSLGSDDLKRTPLNALASQQDGIPQAGMRLWLKGDAGVVTDATGKISVWEDQSGRDKHYAQANAANRPILQANALNGNPVVTFDAATRQSLQVSQLMTGASSGEIYAVIRAAQSDPPVGRGMWQFGTNYGGNWPHECGDLIDDFGSTARKGFPGGVDVTEWHMYNATSRANEWIARLDAKVTYQTTVNTVAFSTTSYIGREGYGGIYHFSGEIAEIIIYDRVLDTDERLAVGRYLNEKYGLGIEGLDPLDPNTPELLTPPMTGNNAPAPYAVFASTTYSTAWPAWGCFDQGTKMWESRRNILGNGCDEHIGVDLGSARILTKYAIVSRPYGIVSDYLQFPRNWTMEGSNDFSTWEVVDAVTDEPVPTKHAERHEHVISNNKAFRYYRLHVTNNWGGSGLVIGEIELYGFAAGSGNSPPEQVTITMPATTLRQGDSLIVNSTAVDANGNMNLHSFFRRGPRPADTFSGDGDGWVRDADDLTGWSNFSTGTPGAPGNGSNSQITAIFTPPASGYWQIKANARDAQDEWGSEAVAAPLFVAPMPSLAIAASTANGGVSAAGNGSLTVYLGETVSVNSTAMASGWLSEHAIHGLKADTSTFLLAAGGGALTGNSANTASNLSATWTPVAAGQFRLYSEAFTGRSTAERINGKSGWPWFAGGPFGGLADWRITVDVRHNPSGSLQLLDEGGNPLSLSEGLYNLRVGDTFYIRINSTDADGDAQLHQLRLNCPSGAQCHWSERERDAGTGANGSCTFGPFQADRPGDWSVWAHISDATARAWGTITPWDGNANGWFTTQGYTIRVIRQLSDIDPNTGLPYGLQDSNGNEVPDFVELGLGLDPAANNDADPRIQQIREQGKRDYSYDANNQLISAPERTYQIDAEGNISGSQPQP